LQGSEAPESPGGFQLRNEETMSDDAKADAYDDAVRDLIERFNSSELTLDEYMDELDNLES